MLIKIIWFNLRSLCLSPAPIDRRTQDEGEIKPDSRHLHVPALEQTPCPLMRTLSIDETAWWQHPLVREIAVILAIKIAIIFALWWAFFDLPDTQRINTTQVSTHVVGAIAPPQHPPEETLK